MKTNKISKEMTHIVTKYRFSFHPMFDGASGLIEIESWNNSPLLFRKPYWEQLYFGHDDPIREAIKFYDENIKLKDNDKRRNN